MKNSRFGGEIKGRKETRPFFCPETAKPDETIKTENIRS
jgi:hypothetical protein